MFVISSLGGGGAERVVTMVSSFLANKKEYKVSIIAMCKKKPEYEYSNDISLNYIENGDDHTFNKMSVLKRLIKIRQIIKREKPDKIISFLTLESVYTFIACTFTKYRKRISFAIRSNPKMEKGIIAKVFSFFVKRVKFIITQNSGQKEYYINKTNAEIYIIPNPIQLDLINYEKKHQKIPAKIVSVGRLIEKKNFLITIDAFSMLKRKYPNLQLFIYGTGPMLDKINDSIAEKKLNGSVFVMGFETERKKIYGDKDIFLLASAYEGMPNVLIEAMCMGVPSISSNCEYGPKDLILNEKMGILFNEINVDSIYNSLENMILNYEYYTNNIDETRKKLIELYSPEIIINKWIEFIEM